MVSLSKMGKCHLKTGQDMSKNGLVSRRKSGLGRTGTGTFVLVTSRAPRKVFSSIYKPENLDCF